MTDEPTPAQDLRSALDPFAALADAILSEAPSGADNIVLFSGCDGKAHTISMDQLRAATAALAQPAENAKGGEVAMREALGFDTGLDASLNLQGALDDLQGRHKINDGGVVERTLRRVIGQIERVRALPLPTCKQSLQVEDKAAEDTCPLCEGREMASGEFCIAGCRNGIVLWTTANVLRNVKPWIDSDQRKIAELRKALSPAAHADVREAKALIANLAAVVRIQNGNQHGDINSLLASADSYLSTPPAALDEGEGK